MRRHRLPDGTCISQERAKCSVQLVSSPWSIATWMRVSSFMALARNEKTHVMYSRSNRHGPCRAVITSYNGRGASVTSPESTESLRQSAVGVSNRSAQVARRHTVLIRDVGGGHAAPVAIYFRWPRPCKIFA
jgi:hypothetical protein